jgi:hypothetical protein
VNAQMRSDLARRLWHAESPGLTDHIFRVHSSAA